MNKRYRLRDGHRRRLVALRKGLKFLDCIVIDGPSTSAERAIAQASIDLHRADFKPGERAETLARIIEETGWTLTEACIRIGISQSYGSKLLALLNLAPDLLEKVNAGVLRAEKGYILSAEPDHDKQRAMLADAGALSRRALRKRTLDGAPPAPEVRASVVRLAMPGDRQVGVHGPELSLALVIATLVETVKQLKKALAEGWDLSTVERVFRDRSKGK